MKYILFMLAMIAAAGASADQYVSPYVRQDGTYVQGHYRSEPNSTRYDNYSTQGNTNPYTGQRGSESPYSSGSGTSAYGGYNSGRSSYDYGYRR